MRRWFYLSPILCKVCDHHIFLEELLTKGRIYEDGTFECAKCVEMDGMVRSVFYLRDITR